jgi:endonuclease/exonuclease/phosphatase family metal-dependent hydrolase
MAENKNLKIVTLNVWRYFDWEKRKDKVINFLKKQKADIVFLQEVAYDERLKDKWPNQVEEINEALKYKSSFYGKLRDMKNWFQDSIDWKMHYGLGVLTKYPITKKKLVILPHVEWDKNFGFLHIEMKTPQGKIDIINVHLENTDKGSKEQLKYILNWCEKRKIKPIIAGDFNMRVTENMKLAKNNYHISYFIKPYKSFMPAKHTTTKIPITIDYILAHKNKFDLSNIKCVKNKISDHYPLLAEVIFRG